ncbi:MAG: HAD family hydrolase [Kofleriaceae bacterium]
MSSRVRALTFDAGQTLVELDPVLLGARLGERGVAVAAAALEEAIAPAWLAYDAAVGTPRAWHAFMAATLEGAGVASAEVPALVDWLWSEQPRRNLWRRPVAGMLELADAARAAGLRIGVISNSEGRLAALFDELGWGGRFDDVVDSGVLGIEKPAPGIFEASFAALGVRADEVVHIGDSWPADVLGACALGARAIWFGRTDDRALPTGVARAKDAAEVAAALASFDVAT